MTLVIYVETGVGGHTDDATQAWSFALEHWGRCGQGHDEPSALLALAGSLGLAPADFEVVERIQGDEGAFARDHQPASAGERAATRTILEQARAATIDLLTQATPAQLDWDDPQRVLPSWACWRTLRQMGWHLTRTESRYYLAALGVQAPPVAGDLIEELHRSHEHVLTTLEELPPALATEVKGQRWTTTKVLRRLAWHERAELEVMRELLANAPPR
ncbi:MAG: DinB family protein [Acidimicrobiia bacterium]